MKVFFFLATLLALSQMSWSQPTAQQFTCVANADPRPIVRVEGITELVGDLLLQCVGGNPTLLGQQIPQFNIKLAVNTAITNRLFPNGASDGLLLIDEPKSATNPNTPQLPCLNLDGCPAVQTTPLIKYGINLPNVYMAKQVSAAAVEWDGVPIDPPGTQGVRVIRLANVRANALQLTGSPGPQQVTAFVGITGPIPITVLNPLQTVGFIQRGIAFSAQPGNFIQNRTANLTGSDGGPARLNLQFSELFPSVFRKAGNASSATAPFTVGPQDIPGQTNTSESGFVPNPALGLPLGVGVADSPTPLVGSLQLDPGCQVMIPSVIPLVTASSSNAGTVLASGIGATNSGPNRVIPAASDGSVELIFLTADVTNTPGLVKSFTVPVTILNCNLVGLPRVITGAGGFAQSPVFGNGLFVSNSTSAPSYPSFSAFDTGIAIAETQRDPTGTVSDPLNSPAGLTFFGGATASFIGLRPGNGTPSGPVDQPEAAASNAVVAPSRFDFGVVSSTGPAIPNVAVTKDPAATWLNVTMNQTTTPVTVTLTVDPTLGAGTYSTNLTFSSPAAGPVPNLVVPVSYKVQTIPWFTHWGFAHNGSYLNNAAAPGEPFVIFGYNFGPSQLAGPVLTSDNKFATTVGSTQVLFDGQAAPLYYSVGVGSAGQVAGFVPFSLNGKSSTLVTVVYNGVASPPVRVPVLDAVPALFTADQSGGGQGAILNQDSSINSASNPATPGSLIVLYGGGAGQTNPGGRDGALAGVGGNIGKFNLPVKVFIDGVLASDVPYIGPAPGLVEGVFQINVRIPANARHPANLPVIVQVEDKVTQPGVTVAVK